MATVATTVPYLSDPELPALTDLLGAGAPEMLAAAVPAAFGEAATVAESRAVQVSWRPGRALTVRYHVAIDGGSGATRNESLVAHTGAILPEGALRLTSEDGDIALWRVADDPWLPGLRAALEPARVRELLASIDVEPGPVHLNLRAYRPGRRAVIEVVTGPHRFFIKVVRPRRVARLQHRHRELEPVLPVPQSHGWSNEAGMVILQAMEGVTLRDCLDDLDGAPPEPAALAKLLDRIPAIDDGAQSRSLLHTPFAHIELLRRLAPGALTEIGQLRDAFEHAAAEETTPFVPIHGDFHEAQLLVLNGGVSALLDIDTVTLGDRADDWAMLIAHLDLHAQSADAARAAHIEQYRDRVHELALSSGRESALRVRIAASVFGQATGPFRVQSPRWPDETRARVLRAAQWLNGEVR
jgi:hypothetical protein